jgi:hypothetical protein
MYRPSTHLVLYFSRCLHLTAACNNPALNHEATCSTEANVPFQNNLSHPDWILAIKQQQVNQLLPLVSLRLWNPWCLVRGLHFWTWLNSIQVLKQTLSWTITDRGKLMLDPLPWHPFQFFRNWCPNTSDFTSRHSNETFATFLEFLGSFPRGSYSLSQPCVITVIHRNHNQFSLSGKSFMPLLLLLLHILMMVPF